MAENTTRKAAALAKLAAAVVLAGALAAGLVLPEIGGMGLATRNSADLINGLPDQLTINPPAGNTKVLAADGSVITEYYTNNRIPVTSDKIATVMKQAQVDIEDSRFYEHAGVDLQGTVRALATNLSAGSVKEGGSTLTQQLVKQTLLQTADTPAERKAAVQQSVGRKIREARLAMGVDQKYSKDEILTRYLNIVYFGEGSYGIEAAAQKYFSTHASDLTLPQAALLAGLVQSPSGDDPITNAAERHVAAQRGAAADARPQAHHRPAVPGGRDHPGPGGRGADPAERLHLRDDRRLLLRLRAELPDRHAEDPPAAARPHGGLTIKTTLQPDLQRSSDQSVLQHVPMGDKFAGILDAVQPGTGHVLAMSINRRFGCKDPDCESVNLNVAPAHGSGSTYKVFTAAAALSAGLRCELHDHRTRSPTPRRCIKGYSGKPARFGPVVVSNDDPGYKATYDMTSALVASTNTYYVALEDALGSITPGVQTSAGHGHALRRAEPGLRRLHDKHQIGHFTLGSRRHEPAGPGQLLRRPSRPAARRCDPTPVTAVLDQNGQPLKDAKGAAYDTGDHCTPERPRARRRQHAGQHDGRRGLPGGYRPQGDHPGPHHRREDRDDPGQPRPPRSAGSRPTTRWASCTSIRRRARCRSAASAAACRP